MKKNYDLLSSVSVIACLKNENINPIGALGRLVRYSLIKGIGSNVMIGCIVFTYIAGVALSRKKLSIKISDYWLLQGVEKKFRMKLNKFIFRKNK